MQDVMLSPAQWAELTRYGCALVHRPNTLQAPQIVCAVNDFGARVNCRVVYQHCDAQSSSLCLTRCREERAGDWRRFLTRRLVRQTEECWAG